MSDLVGNPENRFSQNEAQMVNSEDPRFLFFSDLQLSGIDTALESCFVCLFQALRPGQQFFSHFETASWVKQH